jgi:hypothetical protein
MMFYGRLAAPITEVIHKKAILGKNTEGLYFPTNPLFLRL